MAEILFDLEMFCFHPKTNDVSEEKHVFICGLARSGTTILLNEIFKSNKFASLNYSDMPFCLAPNLWKNVSRKFMNPLDAQERSHGDGIFINNYSPEAFEEVFWLKFIEFEFIQLDKLLVHTLSDYEIKKFKNYMDLICFKKGKRRYLSKNNNNILRLKCLSTQFPQSIFIIPIRSPLQHAQSLLNQHERFLQSDPFTKKYMGWLGHFEFGSMHKLFWFSDNSHKYNDSSNVNYWLENWIDCYQYLMEIKQSCMNKNIVFVCYEHLCDQKDYWVSLTKLLNIHPEKKNVFLRKENEINIDVDGKLSYKAEQIFDNIIESSRIFLNI